VCALTPLLLERAAVALQCRLAWPAPALPGSYYIMQDIMCSKPTQYTPLCVAQAVAEEAAVHALQALDGGSSCGLALRGPAWQVPGGFSQQGHWLAQQGSAAGQTRERTLMEQAAAAGAKRAVGPAGAAGGGGPPAAWAQLHPAGLLCAVLQLWVCAEMTKRGSVTTHGGLQVQGKLQVVAR
jgi:hypothetical protein